jgi:two-component system sensor histidine kinase YesM
MKDRISELVGEVNARNASLLSIAEDRRLAEIRALEAQVNPHFLYNTLNTLNWLAIKAGQDVLSQALSDLAEIMRYSISQIDIASTLQEERVWLEKYLSLQKLRFGKNLEYRIEDRGVRPGFRLYKLLFQPFVENSLIHGFDLKQPGRLLEIRFEPMERGHVRTIIRDNGRGFDVEKTRAKTAESSIGILNVERRLKSYYGDEAVLAYTSALGKGTEVILEIPEVRA